ncbi:M56 family metallopeptidase [Sphingorhabdus sp.]|jgi:bla regulator protein BlaR1|uniref:M56 family metallopeptidase n=1 Tax=Sphingorhabdus sp. TaxID=1902408 RepID=UPI0035B23545|nr:hypothetical protein [Sphingomonadaceae bacterium]
MTEWLGDTLLATSALLLLVLLIRAPVARYFGAGAAYFLWALPAARLFMPTLTREIRLPAPTPDTGMAVGAGDAVAHAATDAVALVAGGPVIDWFVIAASLWLGGAVLLFIVQMYRYLALRDELLSDARDIDVIDGIRIIQTDRIPGPLAFGLLRRYVAVPREFTRTFSPRERELALAHELAHHRGGDLFANMAAFIFLCLMWFNPLAWMAWSAFRFDQEAACDARVVAGADAATRQSYGRALARTATEGLPAFAMALNNPKTIIQRLRRLMMNETSKGRSLSGKLAILVAAAVALPMTATVVPVFAEDDATPADSATDSAAEKQVEVRKHKIVIVKNTDGKDVSVDVSGDAETPFVRKIEKDGRTIVLRTNKELSEAEVEKMVAEAAKSREEAEASIEKDGTIHGKTRVIVRTSGDGNDAHSFAWSADGKKIAEGINVSAFIPDIDIKEIRKNCEEGQPVSTDVQGFDGKNKSRIKLVMCGKGQAKVARQHAIQGLKEARDEIRADGDMPESVRKDVVKKLEEKIEALEKQISANSAAGTHL